MNDAFLSDQHLSQLQTCWSMVHDAKLGSDANAEARERLLERYLGAVHRYILAVVKDPVTADDLTQDFALKFTRGDMRHAEPDRGSFRKFVKTVVLNLVRDHHRRNKSQPDQLPEVADLTASSTSDDQEQRFLESWRQELLNQAWGALKIQTETDLPLYEVLTFRAEHPDLRSPQLAEQLSSLLGKPVTANWVRQVLYRARQQFADQLLQSVLHSLNQPTCEELEAELREIGLYEYCQHALKRRQ